MAIVFNTFWGINFIFFFSFKIKFTKNQVFDLGFLQKMWTNCIIFKQRYFCLNTWFSCFLIFQKFDAILRYYAAFKLKKCESLFYKIDTFLQKNYHLHWIASRANFLSKYMIYIFFNFGVTFAVFFPLLFPKAPAFFL